MRSLGKSIGEPLLTKYLQATSNKEQFITSPIEDVSLVKNEDVNLFIFCPNFPNLKGTQNNSLVIGRPGKGTKFHFLKRVTLNRSLQPKKLI